MSPEGNQQMAEELLYNLAHVSKACELLSTRVTKLNETVDNLETLLSYCVDAFDDFVENNESELTLLGFARSYRSFKAKIDAEDTGEDDAGEEVEEEESGN